MRTVCRPARSDRAGTWVRVQGRRQGFRSRPMRGRDHRPWRCRTPRCRIRRKGVPASSEPTRRTGSPTRSLPLSGRSPGPGHVSAVHLSRRSLRLGLVVPEPCSGPKPAIRHGRTRGRARGPRHSRGPSPVPRQRGSPRPGGPGLRPGYGASRPDPPAPDGGDADSGSEAAALQPPARQGNRTSTSEPSSSKSSGRSGRR